MSPERKSYCPYVKAPFDECYLSEMDSGSVEKAIAFCAGNYKKCEIYTRNIPAAPAPEVRGDKR